MTLDYGGIILTCVFYVLSHNPPPYCHQLYKPVSFRSCMNGVGLIRDRKYRLRTYRSCFQGNETVDWMVRSKRCDDRLTAVRIMRTLQKWSFFHHGEFFNLVYYKILTISQCLDSFCHFPSLIFFLQFAMTTTLRMNCFSIGFVAMMTLSNLRKISYSSTKCSIFTTRRYFQGSSCKIEKKECLICNSFLWSILFLNDYTNILIA